MLVCIADKGRQLEGCEIIDREEMSWREGGRLWCARRVSLSRALSEGLYGRPPRRHPGKSMVHAICSESRVWSRYLCLQYSDPEVSIDFC